MDPNWFYSTLAQSTAAIVGLTGGFLFSWLLSRRGEVIVERRKYIDRLNEIIKNLKKLKQKAETVCLQIEDVLGKIGDQKAAGASHDCLEIPRFELLSHCAYEVPHPTVEDIKNLEQLPLIYTQLLDAIVIDRGELALALLSGKRLEQLGALWQLENKIMPNPFEKIGICPENFWPGILMQKDFAIWQWQEIAREYDQLAADIKSFRERLIPRSIYFLIWVLMGLVGAGMVAPMAFLSAHEGPLKWVLFAIFSPLVFAFVGYLAYEVKQLRHAADLSRDTI